MIDAQKTDRCGGEGLHDAQCALMTGPVDAELVRRYYDDAVESRQILAAAAFFEKLLNRYPGNQQIRSLFISLCLQIQRYGPAMAAIETMLAYSTPEEGLIDSALMVRRKIDPRKIDLKGKAGLTLSVCMIVRNEQSYMGPCLHSIKKIADEIVVMDTGSTDRTSDLASVFGACVHNFRWQDDFSAARNAGLQKAGGDWILVIDADEIIAPEDMPRLKNLICEHKNRPTAFTLETRNYTHVANSLNWHANNGRYPLHETGLGWFPSQKIRLFPNLPGIRFQYPVHELVDPSVRAAGLPIKYGDIPVHHYGHLNENKNRRKAEDYFKMGYQKLHQLGDDVAALRELAVQAGQLEYWSESLMLWRRLLKIRPDFIEAFVNMSGALWQLGRYEEALTAAQSAMTLNPAMKEAGYNCAISLLLLGRAQEALSILSALCETFPDYLGAQFMLASCLGCIGDVDASSRCLHKLKNTTTAVAVIMAIRDLIKRLRNNGRAKYANQLEQAVGRFAPRNQPNEIDRV